MPSISLSRLATAFLRIGNTTFGGGDPTILALGRELVERQRVLTREQYALCFALCRITPATNMLAFCAGVAWLLRGWTGAIIAVAAVTVPSSILAVLLVGAFVSWSSHPVGAAAISAMVAAAVGMMLAGAWLMIRPQITRTQVVRTTVFLAAAFLLAWFSALSPISILALAALAGLLWKEPERA